MSKRGLSKHSSHQESAAKLKESEEPEEDCSRLDLVPEEIKMQDLVVKIRSQHHQFGSEQGEESPVLNESKDASSTIKEDITSVIKRKVFECPEVVEEDPVEINLEGAFKRNQTESTTSMKQRKKNQTEEGYDIFKKFMQQDTESESFAYRFITHPLTQIVFIFVTLYSLFADDYRIIASYKSTDGIYDIFTIIIFCMFLIEIIIYSLFKDEYIFSYHFWLDVVSTVSLLLDINLVSNYINGKNNGFLSSISVVGKISRLLRVVRLVRISKLYKTLNIVGAKKSGDTSRDSKVGRKMTEQATKTVIISSFILLIFLPILSADLYLSDTISIDPACQNLKVILQMPDSATLFDTNPVYNETNLSKTYSAATAEKYLNYYVNHLLARYSTSDNRLLKIDFIDGQYTYYLDPDFSKRRAEEMNYSTCQFESPKEKGKMLNLVIWQDYSYWTVVGAILNIIRTLFICCIVLGGSLWFGRRIHVLMIQPIERMIEKVTLLIQKPQKIKERAFIKQEEDFIKGIKLEDDADMDEDEGKKKKEELETVRIESAINKIGILLGVGFGDAGTNLINLYLSKEGEGDLLIPGAEIEAIYGFCDIRRFTDVTEVLQEEVMVFVNSIAEIVHSLTDKYLGSANKNIGDAFLLVWKQPKPITEYMSQTKTNQQNVMTCLADLALIAFLKIYCEINRAFKLVKYVEDKRIKKHVDENFKVRMGFGLHYGWAIEGAIGSYFKVDVSYLSPNVNMAARLEAATKQYDVPILLSGEFFDILSISIKRFCRKVDIVNVKGSLQALRLYSPDITDQALVYPSKPPLITSTQVTKDCYAFKKLLIQQIINGVNIGPPLFENDPEIKVLFCYNEDKFTSYFNTAIEAYERGEWKMCKDFVERSLKIRPKDGPCLNIYEYIGSFGYKSPPDWKGVRALTEK